MNTSKQLAKHVTDLHFGGNWTTSSLKDNLTAVSWQQSTTKLPQFNTIAALAYHINYYVSAIIKVLQGQPLLAKDAESFSHPPITSAKDWEDFLEKMWADARTFASLVDQLPESRLEENFTHEKYGTYYRNLQGIIEHSHYHLGQIVLLKKMVLLVDKS